MKAARTREEAEFYSSYKPMEGVMTALVLGGFFVFVCLLVLYKTQCKPMWKNRHEQDMFRVTIPNGKNLPLTSIWDVPLSCLGSS